MQLGLLAGLASAWLGIWVAKERSKGARDRKPITWILRLGITLLIGSLLLVRPALGQVSAENGSRHSAGQIRVANELASPLDAKLILRVYNYARIDSGLLGGAEKVTASIFEKVGIRIAWEDCAVSSREWQAYPACQSDMGAADLVLRILPEQMAKRVRASEDALGFAQACPEREPACELSVFYSRVEKLAAAKGYRAERILGYVMAHEVAHVLIGSGHSDAGMMRGEWSPNCLQRISWGMALDFTKEQSRELGYAVVRRARAVEEASTEARLIGR